MVVSPRNAERTLEVVGRASVKDNQFAEEWIIGKYAYYSTISDHFFVYDISDPANPKLTDTIKVDARIINDISTTADGKILVISREGASNRKNGIAFYDTSDPAHPKPISEYTATVTGGACTISIALIFGLLTTGMNWMVMFPFVAVTVNVWSKAFAGPPALARMSKLVSTL